MQATSPHILKLKDVQKSIHFGLENIEVYPLANNVAPIFLTNKTSQKNKFISLIYKSMKRAAMFILVFGFLMLFQDFMFHYFEHKNDIHFIHHPILVDETPTIANNNTPDIAVLDSFVAGFEAPILEEENITETPNSTSNQTYSQSNVDTYLTDLNSTDSAFYIIVGTFKNEANADRLSFSLMKNGIETNVISTENISRVSVAKFLNRQKAEEKLNNYKRFDKNVWVYAVSK